MNSLKIIKQIPSLLLKLPQVLKKHDRLFATKSTKIAAVGPPQVPQEEYKKCVKKIENI